MDRHGALRLDDVVHVQQFALIAVAGHMHGGIVSIDHTSAKLHQLVDDLVHAMLVARNQGARKNDSVEFVDGDVAMIAVGDTAKRGHRLALGTGAHVDELVVLHIMGLLQVDDRVFRKSQVAQIRSDGHVANHGTAHEHHLATVLVGGVDNLLHTVHMAGEAGHDDLARGLGERLIQRRANGGFRLDEAWNLSVGGIHHQQIHALFAELAELHQISDAMVKRQLVKLDIAGIDEASGRSLHEHSQSVRNGMRDVHELKIERTDLQLVTTLDLNQSRIDAMLLALGFNESQRELGTNQRNVGAELQQIRHAADMILVAVGKHQSLDLVETILDVVEVRQNQIDTRLLLFGEKHTAVDEQQVAVVFDHVHVTADFAQATKRHDAHGALTVLRRSDQHVILLGRGGLRSKTGIATASSRRACRAGVLGTSGVLRVLCGLHVFRALRALGGAAAVAARTATNGTGRIARTIATATATARRLRLLGSRFSLADLLRAHRLHGLHIRGLRVFSALGSFAAALVRSYCFGFFYSHFLVGFPLLIVSACAETRNSVSLPYYGKPSKLVIATMPGISAIADNQALRNHKFRNHKFFNYSKPEARMPSSARLISASPGPTFGRRIVVESRMPRTFSEALAITAWKPLPFIASTSGASCTAMR